MAARLKREQLSVAHSKYLQIVVPVLVSVSVPVPVSFPDTVFPVFHGENGLSPYRYRRAKASNYLLEALFKSKGLGKNKMA